MKINTKGADSNNCPQTGRGVKVALWRTRKVAPSYFSRRKTKTKSLGLLTFTHFPPTASTVKTPLSGLKLKMKQLWAIPSAQQLLSMASSKIHICRPNELNRI